MIKYKFGRRSVVGSTSQGKARLYLKVTILTLLLLAPVVVYIIYSTLPPPPVSGRTVDKEPFDPYVTFTTEYFTFRATKQWTESDTGNIPGKMYVYKQSTGLNPTGLLRIYINSDPPSYQNYYTRVLPVKVIGGKKFTFGTLQPDCTSAIPAGENKGTPIIVGQGGTSFLCWTGGTNFYAVTGEVGGNSSIEMTRTDGSKAKYLITYVNNAFSPTEGSFAEVLKNFEAR